MDQRLHMVGSDGTLSDVLWESPAFDAGLTVGAQLLAVNGRAYSASGMTQAITDAAGGEPIELLVKSGQQVRLVPVCYTGGLRYPHLQRSDGERARLEEILAPRLQPR